MTPSKKHIYCMPGLGANARIFERLKWDNEQYEIHLWEWKTPLKNETIDEYVQSYMDDIKFENPILIGVSFGGMIVQKIAEKISCEKVFVISSIQSEEEYSPILRKFKKYKAYRLFPSKRVGKIIALGKILPKKTLLAKKLKMYNIYLTAQEPQYLDWALRNVLQFQKNKNTVTPESKIIHIHGTRDHIFPIQYLKSDIIKIKNGTHAMILFNANEISKIIQEKLNYDKNEQI